MSTEPKKESERKKHQAAIEQRRMEEGFLPQYSDFYFEKKQRARSTWLAIWLCLISFIPVPAILFLLYYAFVQKFIMERQKMRGIRFEESGIVKLTAYGEKTVVPYSWIEQSVTANRICYKKTGMQIGTGIEKLVFHYEIGDSTAQRHIEDCYAFLQKHLSVKLPPFEKKCFGLLDRKYFYEKSRKNQILSLICAVILFRLLLGTLLANKACCIFFSSAFALWECYSLYLLCKSGKLLACNQVKLMKIFQEYPNAKFGWRYTGYVYFVVTAIVLISINGFIIYS